MLSHHAPPKRLLQNFAYTKEGSYLWVYSKNRPPRLVHKVTAESAEHGYFANDPFGRTEKEIEEACNNAYERPFNRLLPALSAGLIVHFDSSLVGVCSDYLSGVFLRSKPRRQAIKAHTRAFNEELSRRLRDPLVLRQYAANASFRTGLPVFLDHIREASEAYLLKDEKEEDIFFQSATTDFSNLPGYLRRMHWALCESPHRDFIQSDVAVALMNVTLDHGVRVGTGTSMNGTQWFLPITPKLSLRASASYIPRKILAAHYTDFINAFMVKAAHTFVYSTTLSATLTEITRKDLFTLHFFRDLMISDVKAEVDVMLAGMLSG